MSLFIGKDISSKNVIHLTSTQESASSMKSGVLPTTTFHSTLPYTSITRYAMVKVSTPTAGSAFRIPSTAIAAAAGHSFMFIGDGTLDTVTPNIHIEYNILRAFGIWSNEAQSSFSTIPTITENIFTFSSNYSQCDILVTNIAFSAVTPVDTQGALVITNSSLTIGTLNLLAYKYLSFEPVNLVDTMYTYQETTIQIVNDVSRSGIELEVTTLPYLSEIRTGGVPIFSSNSPLTAILGSTLYFLTTPYNTAGTFSITIPSSIKYASIVLGVGSIVGVTSDAGSRLLIPISLVAFAEKRIFRYVVIPQLNEYALYEVYLSSVNNVVSMRVVHLESVNFPSSFSTFDITIVPIQQ